MSTTPKSSIVGYHSTRFGELWEKSLTQLLTDALLGALKQTMLEATRIDAVFLGNMLGGVAENNLHLTAKVAEILGVHIPVFRVEAACASGGMAFHLAHSYCQAGRARTVLVVGVEKMTDLSPDEATSALAAAAAGEEQEAGITFPGLYAMMARYYLEKYRYKADILAPISVKNHFHGSLNPYAHFRRQITEQQVIASTCIADPLRVLDCSPVSDGAAALVITNDSSLIKKHASCAILATETATDTLSLSKRKRIDGLDATIIAADKAYKAARKKPKDIHVAEVHDCFSIAELFAMEDLGFWKKGTGGSLTREYRTRLGSEGGVIVNTSGGLKSAGHPVGATGVKQIGELYLQLTNTAHGRQVEGARVGLAHNVGGSGGTAVVSILTQT